MRLDRPVKTSDAMRLPVVQVESLREPGSEVVLQSLASSGTVIVADPGAHPGTPVVAALPATAFALETASVTARRRSWSPVVAGVPVTALLASNRPDRLPAILRMLTAQVHRPLEIVVVLHGVDQEAAPAGAIEDCAAQLPTTVLHVPADVPFGSALTAGARASSGTVVTKVDDDDLYGPWHVTDLLVARAHSGAQAVGKAMQYVRIDQLDVTVRLDGATMVSEPEAYGTWVCGGTLTVDRADGDALGWFDPLPRAVDRNLQDKILRAAGRVYRTHGLDYVYVRHGDGHTYATDWGKYLRGSIEQRTGQWPLTPGDHDSPSAASADRFAWAAQ
jgi:hypothetical protein